MSTIQEAVKKAEAAANLEAHLPPDHVPATSTSSTIAWWLPNLLMFLLLAVALWNYMSEREYRRQMEARLENTISELEGARADFRRVERQSRQMEDLMHAELEAANGRIAKMKFDVDTLRTERDSADAALAAANDRVVTLESQNRRLHEVIQSLRGRGKTGAAASGTMAWDRGVLPASRES